MAKYEEWLKEESLIKVTGWAKEGLSDEQIAKAKMHIAYSTFKEWKKKYSAFSDALKVGKEVADFDVENELYMSAHTRTVKVKKVFKLRTSIREGNHVVEEERLEVAEEEVLVPGNVTAQIFWLKNRRPDKWRDKPDYVAGEAYEDDGLMKALDSAVADMDDDSWMVEDEES